MTKERLLLQKIPKSPLPRIQLLKEFLGQWRVQLKPKKCARALAAAKKRVGALPKCLPDFYESGLFEWFQKIAKKRPEWYFNFTWVPLEELSFNEEFGIVPLIWERQAAITGVAREHIKLSDPPVTIWNNVNRTPKSSLLQVKLSEFLLREGIVNVLRTQPTRAFRVEEGKFKQEHPSRLRLREKLKPISLDPNRGTATELYFAGPGIVARERCPSANNIDIEVAATSKAVLDSYLEKAKPQARSTSVKTKFWDAPQTKAALKKSNGGFPSDKFKPKSATISANITEAPSGYSVVDWAIHIRFGDVKIDDRKYNCAINVDRIHFDIKDWRELDGCVFAGDRKLSIPQVHFYSGIWDNAERYEFRIQHDKARNFKIAARFELSGIFANYPPIICQCETFAEFTGIHLSYDNFKIKKMTPKRRDALIANLFDAKAFQIKHSKGSTMLSPKSK